MSSNTTEYINFIHAKTYFTDFPKLIGNDVCTKATWTAYYWPEFAGVIAAALGLALLF
jgi:hypothetical protein